MSSPLRTVAETGQFLRDADAERMPLASRLALKAMLAEEPESGDLIVGSGGIRKFGSGDEAAGRAAVTVC